VLRCVDLEDFSVTAFHLGVAPFSGRRDHINIKAWTQRFLHRFGVRNSDICSSTSDSGSNVKKALSELWPRWILLERHAQRRCKPCCCKKQKFKKPGVHRVRTPDSRTRPEGHA